LLLLERQVSDYELSSRLKNCCTDLQVDVNFAKSPVTCIFKWRRLCFPEDSPREGWYLPTTESHNRATKKYGRAGL